MLSLILAASLAAAPPADDAPPPARVTICHATGSLTHPWEEITVAEPALEAHDGHGDLIPAPAEGCPAGPEILETAAQPEWHMDDPSCEVGIAGWVEFPAVGGASWFFDGEEIPGGEWILIPDPGVYHIELHTEPGVVFPDGSTVAYGWFEAVAPEALPLEVCAPPAEEPPVVEAPPAPVEEGASSHVTPPPPAVVEPVDVVEEIPAEPVVAEAPATLPETGARETAGIVAAGLSLAGAALIALSRRWAR